MFKKTIWQRPLLTIAALLFTAASADAAESQSIPLQPELWESKNDVSFVTYKDKQSIHLNGGFKKQPGATLKNYQLTDGTIEFEMSINHSKSIFPGIDVRISEQGDGFERIYFRPGNNQQINSFQYHPVYRHIHAWQLYGQHQRDITMPDQEWFRVRIELRGPRIACYLGDQKHPFFWTNRLQSGSPSGAIRFAGAGDYHIANLRISKLDNASTGTIDLVSKTLPSTYLSSWKTSPVLELTSNSASATLDQFHELAGEWKNIQAEDQGLVNFSRHLGQNGTVTALLAKTEIIAQGPQKKKLSLGYSDRIDLYLNGELIFSGNNTFRHEDSQMRSRVHLDNNIVELELSDGSNKLEAIVYERFGGWALMARLKDVKGLTR